MKAITIWQPYATLLAMQVKLYETRGWFTRYRGPIAIHAARHWTKETKGAAFAANRYLVEHQNEIQFAPDLLKIGELKWEETLGKVLAIGELQECIKADDPSQFSDLDNQFGWLGPGRWAWRIGNIQPVTPIAVTGQQGLWQLPPDVAEALRSVSCSGT
jgi:hypothetical protein